MSQLDYALIGNCQISALLDRQGSYAWCCMPRFDSPSVFASIVGGDEAGSWSCVPENAEFKTHQRYMRNTNIVLTEFHLKNGDRFDVFDFAPRYTNDHGHHRPPQLMRIIRPVKGSPRIKMVLKPRMAYGSLTPEASVTGNGIAYRAGDTHLYFRTDIPYTYVIDGQGFELTGDRYCVLSHGEPFPLPLKFGLEEALDRTAEYWRTWVKHCSIPFEYQEAVIRSALALKLHIFEDTGAIVAATTTSIPESPTGGRTWDYRYCWLRDAYFVIGVLNQLGHFEEMERFIQYLHNISVSEGGELQPVYGIGGERELHERELPWLKGFRGIGPVRVGNAAFTHAQYDVYGEMALSMTPLFFDSRLDRIDLTRAFENVVRLVEQAIRVFDHPDSGIWEFRSERQHYTFSKVMCWAAVDRGIKVATQVGHPEYLSRWTPIRDQMRARIEKDGWNSKSGFYTQSLNGTNADASNLLMGAVNFHSPSDVQYRAMVEQYERLLMNDGYAFRYKNADDFGVPSHAFTICTFWMVDALASIGRLSDARAIFESVLTRCNHVGLLSEDIDPVSGELWGNFPQTYSHVGIITSAMRLSKSWGEAF
jgi:GH15 family glucan-1,4-alpha-glucosidase